jgi:PAS domain S-box-containing protein
MNPRSLAALPEAPSPRTGWVTALVITAAWGILRLGVFRTFVFPLTYVLPLLLCTWTRSRTMLWLMAAAFAAMHTFHQFWLLPADALSPPEDLATWWATILNIVLGAFIVHVVIALRDQVERSFAAVVEQSAELERQNEELARQSEELASQSEELSQQVEELTRQSDQVAAQNDELQSRSEEIGGLNSQLEQREHLLQTLLDAVRTSVGELSAVEHICRTSLEMFGHPVRRVVVYELQFGRMIVRGAAGFGEAAGPSEHEAGARFARLVIEENRPASLHDVALRTDLVAALPPGAPPIRAVLGSPLRLDERPFGAVVVFTETPYEWTEGEYAIVEWLARQVGGILQTLRLQSDLQRHAALINLSPDAILVRKPDGTITLWGRGAEALYGWSAAEAIGRRSHDLLQTQFHPPLAELEAQLADTGRWTGELVHTSKDGRAITVESRWLAWRDDQGRVVDLLESNVDITDRKRAELQLRETDRRRGEFLATLSHELRNPLAPIRYALELLGKESHGPSASQATKVIERQLAHLVHLVDDLLDMTRIASNKVQLRRGRVELAAIVDQAVDTVIGEARETRHELSVSLPPQPVWLEADAIRLTQVLTNLLLNAVRYTPLGGRIEVRSSTDGNDVIVSVKDTGIGLKHDDLERVFEMFTQVGEPGLGGLGIGLALVKSLVELHGGRVEARSDGLGKGAEFLVTLPLAPATPAESPAAGGRAAAGSSRRVLVVDDNVDAADMMRTFLELDGHEVQVAYDAPTAIALVRERRPDVGLFDIGLPGMNGYELAEQLRRNPENGSLFLVAVTGWGQKDDRDRATASGFDAHLTKPPAPDAIRSLIASAPALTARRTGGPATPTP